MVNVEHNLHSNQLTAKSIGDEAQEVQLAIWAMLMFEKLEGGGGTRV